MKLIDSIYHPDGRKDLTYKRCKVHKRWCKVYLDDKLIGQIVGGSRRTWSAISSKPNQYGITEGFADREFAVMHLLNINGFINVEENRDNLKVLKEWNIDYV